VRHARWGVAVSLLLLACFTPAEPDMAFRYRRLIPAGLFSFFLVLLAIHDPTARRLFAFRPLRAVGLFSYSLYLIHGPIIDLTYVVTKGRGWPEPVQFFFYQGLVLPICVLAGYLFYRVAEKPFLKRRPGG
jgi:peptidoglycan/LPS O-acetylase OafA/YrhL